MLEGPQEGGQCEEGKGGGGMVAGDYEELEEGEYHLLEEVEGGERLTYEVPIPTISAQSNQQASKSTPHCSTSNWAPAMNYDLTQHVTHILFCSCCCSFFLLFIFFVTGTHI